MVPGRILITAALLSLAGGSVQAGESRRLWTDPPSGVGPAAGAPEALPSETSSVGTWPDEAQRRRLPELAGSAPAETFASTGTGAVAAAAVQAEPADAEPRPVETIDSQRDGAPETRPAPMRSPPRPAISERARRRLGVLSGFAGAAAAPDANAAPAGSVEEASGRRGQQVRGGIGRMRILQIRRGRVVLVYTRS